MHDAPPQLCVLSSVLSKRPWAISDVLLPAVGVCYCRSKSGGHAAVILVQENVSAPQTCPATCLHSIQSWRKSFSLRHAIRFNLTKRLVARATRSLRVCLRCHSGQVKDEFHMNAPFMRLLTTFVSVFLCFTSLLVVRPRRGAVLPPVTLQGLICSRSCSRRLLWLLLLCIVVT